MSASIASGHAKPSIEHPSARRVLVSYEPSKRGHAALRHAINLARASGSRLIVTAVLPRAPVNGCARCRQSAVLWNQEMRSVASEELASAARLVGDSRDVEYVPSFGEPLPAMAEAAERCAADVIVLPEQPTGLRRLFSPRIADKLRGRGDWEVVVAPYGPGSDRAAGQGLRR